ncbi:MAG: hypothetical protein M3Q29_10445 [Chloroflexota bacterium]|nr:hypothetical protein [Chloroflexota bacterium]
MNGRIYLVQDNGELLTMEEEGYATEDLLQELLAKYPALLAGEQMDSSSPRRWLLISREVPLASDEGGTGRWSVDHLFPDQDAAPTIVEVKRSSDTRIRREVVGQMLDYAANAVLYWPAESIRARFEASSDDPEQDLSGLIGTEGSADAFWAKLKTNLQAGRLRMVFVADEIPSELQRIVEFLNGQLTTAEVLAVEVKQYVGQGVRTLVPRVIGLTSEAERSKSTGRGARRTGDETSFFQDLSARQGPDAAANEEAITAIYEWCRDKQLSFRWGWRGVQGNVYVGVPQSGKTHYIFSMWSGGGMVIEFGYLKKEPPFDDEMKRIEFLRQLNEIPGIALPDSAIQRYAHVPVSPFHNEAGRSQFLRAIDWAVKGIQST